MTTTACDDQFAPDPSNREAAIGQNGNDGQHYPDTKTWWTRKPCTLCGLQTAAKVSDNRPVCPGCVVKHRIGEAERTPEDAVAGKLEAPKWDGEYSLTELEKQP